MKRTEKNCKKLHNKFDKSGKDWVPEFHPQICKCTIMKMIHNLHNLDKATKAKTAESCKRRIAILMVGLILRPCCAKKACFLRFFQHFK